VEVLPAEVKRWLLSSAAESVRRSKLLIPSGSGFLEKEIKGSEFFQKLNIIHKLRGTKIKTFPTWSDSLEELIRVRSVGRPSIHHPRDGLVQVLSCRPETKIRSLLPSPLTNSP